MGNSRSLHMNVQCTIFKDSVFLCQQCARHCVKHEKIKMLDKNFTEKENKAHKYWVTLSKTNSYKREVYTQPKSVNYKFLCS